MRETLDDSNLPHVAVTAVNRLVRMLSVVHEDGHKWGYKANRDPATNLPFTMEQRGRIFASVDAVDDQSGWRWPVTASLMSLMKRFNGQLSTASCLCAQPRLETPHR